MGTNTDTNTKSNPININISKTKSSKKDNVYGDFKDYIILNNVELQKELKASFEHIKRLEATVAEKEAEEDKYDDRVRYMKGLLQNLYYLKTEYTYLQTKESEKCIILCKSMKNVNKTHISNYMFATLIAGSIGTIHYSTAYIFSSIIIMMLNLSVGAALCYSVHKLFKNYRFIVDERKIMNKSVELIDSQIRDRKKEIKKTEESTVTLDNWISEI